MVLWTQKLLVANKEPILKYKHYQKENVCLLSMGRVSLLTTEQTQQTRTHVEQEESVRKLLAKTLFNFDTMHATLNCTNRPSTNTLSRFMARRGQLLLPATSASLPRSPKELTVMLRVMLKDELSKAIEEALSPAGSTRMERGNRKYIMRDVISRQVATARETYNFLQTQMSQMAEARRGSPPFIGEGGKVRNEATGRVVLRRRTFAWVSAADLRTE